MTTVHHIDAEILLTLLAHRWMILRTSTAPDPSVFDHTIKVMVSVAVLSTLALFIISIASDGLALNLPFNPRDFPKKVVTCPAPNRAQNITVDIDLRMAWYCGAWTE